MVEKQAVLTPMADNTNDRPFIFLYADVAIVEGVLLARDADVVNLAELVFAGAAQGDLAPSALRGATKSSDRPVAVASIAPFFFDPEWYLKNFSDIYLIGFDVADSAWQHYQDMGASGRAPSPWPAATVREPSL